MLTLAGGLRSSAREALSGSERAERVDGTIVMDMDELVAKFADAVVKQPVARDPVVGTKHTKAYIAAFRALAKQGANGLDALSSLLNDRRADVRVVAAAYLLRHCETKARAVLSAEANGSGLLAFSAQQALARWEDGTWELDK